MAQKETGQPKENSKKKSLNKQKLAKTKKGTSKHHSHIIGVP